MRLGRAAYTVAHQSRDGSTASRPAGHQQPMYGPDPNGVQLINDRAVQNREVNRLEHRPSPLSRRQVGNLWQIEPSQRINSWMPASAFSHRIAFQAGCAVEAFAFPSCLRAPFLLHDNNRKRPLFSHQISSRRSFLIPSCRLKRLICVAARSGILDRRERVLLVGGDSSRDDVTGKTGMLSHSPPCNLTVFILWGGPPGANLLARAISFARRTRLRNLKGRRPSGQETKTERGFAFGEFPSPAVRSAIAAMDTYSSCVRARDPPMTQLEGSMTLQQRKLAF
ncbi:hypothetical protein N658DRAFT_250603 [Parathielavia hyrcaniae]|uniref:Uncharacterized protein n=1 Tax=Parathielavia hyrcaniae TaxID=113614 RepID=A0AAN6T4C5_9PEZI|nr:hypothetical protein N658DRAFT_250603 [Parathielavia hyrcaniae]